MNTKQFDKKQTDIINHAIQCLIGTGDFKLFMKNQVIGDCLRITENAYNILVSLGMKNVVRVCGGLEYPFTICSIEGIQCTELIHWWLEIDNKIIEFCKGTIVDVDSHVNIFSYVNMDSVDPDPLFNYRK